MKRATILIPSGPPDDLDRLHLFILLTNPVGDFNELLITSVSSVKDGFQHDNACLLPPQCHSFIYKHSWVEYSKCRLTTEKKLISGIESGLLIPKEEMDREIFLRVCEGLMSSDHARQKHQQFYLRACESIF